MYNLVLLFVFSILSNIGLSAEELDVKEKYTYDIVSGFCSCYQSGVRIYEINGVPEGRYVYSRYVNECGVGYKSRYSCNIVNIKPKEGNIWKR